MTSKERIAQLETQLRWTREHATKWPNQRSRLEEEAEYLRRQIKEEKES